ncbi:hypothetical protein AXW67_03375 [Bradyrhizobium neotropicale]|uniref:Uncharacterized protein n=1 Tax=Bradyrhizobium neotropicale TaxID=1497615 RepID=A0A176ZDE9_9BRAD|nr:hypothetical protein AXW67_03375 [Bradyrhizobium neotropicale]
MLAKVAAVRLALDRSACTPDRPGLPASSAFPGGEMGAGQTGRKNGKSGLSKGTGGFIPAEDALRKGQDQVAPARQRC